MSAAAGPPSRDAGSENFPVASFLLAPALRPKVLGFYRFVRTADDIADAPDLAAAEKLRRLDVLEHALDDPGTDEPAARPLHASGAGTQEARAMLAAFRQDATQNRIADWAALEAYCAASANPVGRMLLRLHGEKCGGRAGGGGCAVHGVAGAQPPPGPGAGPRHAGRASTCRNPGWRWRVARRASSTPRAPRRAVRCSMPRWTGWRSGWMRPRRCRGWWRRGAWRWNRG